MVVDWNPRGLDAAFEGLYRAFARYPLHAHVAGCPCCVGEADEQQIRSKPLRQLATEDVSRYAWKAMTTWGDVDDFKHFLPRLLELMSTDEAWPDSQEVLAGKLSYAKVRTWDAAEQSALDEFFRAWWARVLTAFPSVVPVHTALCCVAHGTGDLRPCLDHFRKLDTPSARRHLAELVQRSCSPGGGVYLGGFWEEIEPAARQVEDWLLEDLTRATLEGAFFRWAEEPFASEFSDAIDRLPPRP